MLCCAVLPFLLDRSAEPARRGRTFPMMGTVGNITIFSDEEALAEAIAGRYPMLGLEFVDAGQEVYRWEIGIM